ncbi:MAG: MlaE family lipid ABC transporter permease subunit [Syntrophobacteraceae bacterium]|nr:MlaE family lipid ABC transporter permease subunit [Syntrophobacteraceae bacterium]
MERGSPFETGTSSEGELLVSFKAPITFENAAEIWEGANNLIAQNSNGSFVLDLSRVTRMDSAGVAFLRLFQRLCRRRGVRFRIQSAPPSIERFLDFFERDEPAQGPPSPPKGSPVARLGAFLVGRAAELQEFADFCRSFFSVAARALRRPGRFRWRESLYYLQLAGADAMTILFLITLLLGVVMAFQAAIQLKQFGANIFVADLVSLALARELAPVFTAMLLAGRSSSFFAAEIGSMKVGEELDALAVMGFNLTEFITLPKVLALMIVAPLLTMWANFAGIIGAIGVCGVSLDITPYAFLHEVFTAVTFGDIAGGLLKAEVFATLIALVGCFRGFQTTMGADSVGRQTTAAVVSGLFLIIFSDAILTVLFYLLGW